MFFLILFDFWIIHGFKVKVHCDLILMICLFLILCILIIGVLILTLQKQLKKKILIRDIKNPEYMDYLQGTNEDVFDRDNIDFKDLKENLNKIHDDPVLVDNTIRHIKETIGSSIEHLWESGTRTKIINRTKGGESYVSISNSLISRGSRGVKTPHMLHNHTSGIPLPHPDDMLHLLDHKIINSTISGNYGVLNMKNSFRRFDKMKKVYLKNEANIMFEDLGKKALDNRLRKKLPKNIIRKDKYKYYKENINTIVEDYNNQFNKYGIKFEYTPYKLKR